MSFGAVNGWSQVMQYSTGLVLSTVFLLLRLRGFFGRVASGALFFGACCVKIGSLFFGTA